jgi:hypothetical protein
VSTSDLNALVARVAAEPELLEPLIGIRESDRFRAAVLEVADQLQLDVDAAEIDDAVTAARRWWFERWI